MARLIMIGERVPAKGCDGPYEINRLGEIFNGKTGRKLKLALNMDGYLYFCDFCDGVTTTRYVHKIMLPSFDVPNPENKPTVNHINGDKADNRLENLEWHTMKEQMEHARDVLGRKCCFRKGQPKPEGSGTPPRPVRGTHRKTGEVREFESMHEAARQVGGNDGNICLVCQGNRKSSAGYLWEYV